ncbi:hypothetical protein J2X06_002530 [Lysobacter niastensis]|uniref:Uncharacterized protein n=1 Tax=Lysobacter niastensis TaxID=380629 RepID=A0ABU1WCK3_9GAMM|nr:hypothetical protein [Lysobacter niastensis]
MGASFIEWSAKAKELGATESSLRARVLSGGIDCYAYLRERVQGTQEEFLPEWSRSKYPNVHWRDLGTSYDIFRRAQPTLQTWRTSSGSKHGREHRSTGGVPTRHQSAKSHHPSCPIAPNQPPGKPMAPPAIQQATQIAFGCPPSPMRHLPKIDDHYQPSTGVIGTAWSGALLPDQSHTGAGHESHSVHFGANWRVITHCSLRMLGTPPRRIARCPCNPRDR